VSAKEHVFLRWKQVVKAVGQLARGHPDGREHAHDGRLRQDPRGGHLAVLRNVVGERLPAIAPENHFWLDNAGRAQFSCPDHAGTRYWRKPARDVGAVLNGLIWNGFRFIPNCGMREIS
jgi:hypothetical protein